MFNRGRNLHRAVLGLSAAAAVFLGSAPMAAVAQERCEARFDFAPAADVSGRVEWRIDRGGLVDIQVEAAPRPWRPTLPVSAPGCSAASISALPDRMTSARPDASTGVTC